MGNNVVERVKELGITIPEAAKPAANYAPYIIHDNQVIISGQLPMQDGKLVTGTLGIDTEIETGIKAAELCAINILGQINDACGGDLERVEQCLKLGVFINSAGDFYDHPKVANGASDLIASVFAEKGVHARFAVGVSALPFNAAVEIDAVFAIK